MRTKILLGAIAAVFTSSSYAEVLITAMLPRQVSATTTTTPIKLDSWTCATINMTGIFKANPPGPVLSTAMQNYVETLLKPCKSSRTGEDRLKCSLTRWADLCEFSTKGPASLTASYSTYAQQLSNWWKTKSGYANFLRRDCPQNWNRFGVLDQAIYNMSTVLAECQISKNGGGGLVSKHSTSSGGGLISKHSTSSMTVSSVSTIMLPRELAEPGAGLAALGGAAATMR